MHRLPEHASRSLSRRQLLERSAVIGAGAAGLLGVSTAAAQEGSPAAEPPADRPVLRHGTNAADIQTLDPHYSSATGDRTIVDMVFNGLVRFKPGDSSQFEPDLATEMPTATDNADGTKTWTFTLRDDVQVHATASTEAYTLTSADVLFSYQKVSNPDTSGNSGNYAGWTFDAPDAQTFTITLEAPVSDTVFLPGVANYAGGYVIPQQPYEALGADAFITNPVGTGPFMFESYTPQSAVNLIANDAYFRGFPQLAGVEVRFVADGNSRELALQSGDLDVANGLPEAQWVDRMNEVEGIQVDVFGVGEVVFLNLDTTNEILQDPKVREAILLSINRENTIALSGSPVSEPSFSVVPPFLPGGLDEAAAAEAGVNFSQDLDRARTLLTEAGYEDGFELDLVSSEQDSYLRAYTVLQEELRQVNITVNLEVVQHQAMHDLIRQGSNAIVIYVAFRPTADVYLTQFFTTGGGVTNFSHYTLDDQVAAARITTDPDEQAALWEQANVDIVQNFAGYGIMYTNQVYAKRDVVDYGHELVSVVQLYPGFNETTSISE
jgi:peptide/nickel transport system substrate-binding protein